MLIGWAAVGTLTLTVAVLCYCCFFLQQRIAFSPCCIVSFSFSGGPLHSCVAWATSGVTHAALLGRRVPWLSLLQQLIGIFRTGGGCLVTRCNADAVSGGRLRGRAVTRNQGRSASLEPHRQRRRQDWRMRTVMCRPSSSVCHFQRGLLGCNTEHARASCSKLSQNARVWAAADQIAFRSLCGAASGADHIDSFHQCFSCLTVPLNLFLSLPL